MKPFNLQDALDGKPICDRSGRELKNFRVRNSNDLFLGSLTDYPFAADSEDSGTLSYTSRGVVDLTVFQPRRDLFMVDEQSEDNQIKALKDEISALKEQIADLNSQLSEMSLSDFST